MTYHNYYNIIIISHFIAMFINIIMIVFLTHITQALMHSLRHSQTDHKRTESNSTPLNFVSLSDNFFINSPETDNGN